MKEHFGLKLRCPRLERLATQRRCCAWLKEEPVMVDLNRRIYGDRGGRSKRFGGYSLRSSSLLKNAKSLQRSSA